MPLPYEITVNRATLEAFSRSRAMGIPYGSGRILCRVLGEFPAFVAIDDLGVGPRLVLDGFWESWVTLAVARYVQPGMWCVDVGANYGYYTLLMAAAVGPEGRVMACEPHPLLSQHMLPAALTLNGFASRVDICQVAISDSDGQVVEFSMRSGNVGSSSLAAIAGQRVGDSDERVAAPIGAPTSAQVRTATLDSICTNWPRLDLIKIDAEGAEVLVWNGMQKTLRRFPCMAVVIELHMSENPHLTLAWLHEIERCGYQLRHINYDGDIVPVAIGDILSNPQEHWMLWLQK
jgi:FkbM family methyltransferase